MSANQSEACCPSLPAVFPVWRSSRAVGCDQRSLRAAADGCFCPADVSSVLVLQEIRLLLHRRPPEVGVLSVRRAVSPPLCTSSNHRLLLLSCSGRSPEEVDMDELMAAMVLSSLSCSPLLHSPPHRDTAGTANNNATSTFDSRHHCKN